jgi:hypothetical protein
VTSLIRRHRGARTAGEETASYLPHVPVSMPEAGWGEWLIRIARSLNGILSWIQAQPPALPLTGGTMTGALIQRPAALVTPAANGDLVVQATSNTQLTFKYKGSDGVVRSANLTLA